jgi:hypothetical protein
MHIVSNIHGPKISLVDNCKTENCFEEHSSKILERRLHCSNNNSTERDVRYVEIINSKMICRTQFIKVI